MHVILCQTLDLERRAWGLLLADINANYRF